MRTSIVPACGVYSTPHIVVIGNQKGGSGKSTFAMHIIIALLKAGKRVASFDLDSNQLTLTRYIGNRREWGREHKLKLKLPDHCPVTEEALYRGAWSNVADPMQFMSRLKKIGREHKHDFVVIDTPGGTQHLSLIANGLADTLITPINDSLIDLDVLVAIEPSHHEPQPSLYAKTVRRALEARRNVCGRATDWIVVRNRLELVRSRNQCQVTQVLEVIRETLGFRTARGLLERPVYREFFAAGLTAFDPVDGLKSGAKPSPSSLLARLEVQDLIREIGLIEESAEIEAALGGAVREIELAMAEANMVDTGEDKPLSLVKRN